MSIISEFPKEYDSSLGITERQYKLLRIKAKDLFMGVELFPAVSELSKKTEQVLQNIDIAYTNIDPKLIEQTGMKRAQVLWAYQEYASDKLFCEKFVKDTDKSKESGKTVLKLKNDNVLKNLDSFQKMFTGKIISDEELESIKNIVVSYQNADFVQQHTNNKNTFAGVPVKNFDIEGR